MWWGTLYLIFQKPTIAYDPIVYYISLYIILRWPPSLFTEDVLFLIPVPWKGPVIAPVLVSILMIISAFVILKRKVWEKEV